MFYGFLSILILIVCVLLILVVLVQNSKGGGLASNFAGSNQIMGVRRTTDFLEKATWILAGALLVMSVLASWAIPKQTNGEKSKVNVETSVPFNGVNPNAVPNIPTGNSQNQTGGQPAQQPVSKPAQQPAGQPAQQQPAQPSTGKKTP